MSCSIPDVAVGAGAQGVRPLGSGVVIPRLTAPSRPSAAPRTGPARRVAAAALAAAVLSTAVACAQDETAEEGPAPAGDEAAETLEPAVRVDAGPAPEVEVLEAGGGERRVLAYAPSSEPAVVAVTRSASATTAVPGAEPSTQTTPAQTLTVEGSSEPDVDGAQRAEVTAREFTSVDEHRNAQFATAAGFTVTWTRDADGSVRSYSLEAPAGATDAARAGIEVTADVVADATVIWPTEEIGVGARWTVTDRVDDAVAPTRVVTYELTRLEGDLATVRSSTTAPETAPVLTAPAPDGGPDVALEVDTYDVTGSGEFTVDLRAALPAEGRTESSTRAVYVDPDSGLRTTHDEDSALEFSPAG